MRTLDEAQSQFAYHPATPDTAPRHAEVRDLFANLLPDFWVAVPDGPEKTLAIRKLQEAQMYANLAIALTAPADTSATRKVARILPVDDNRDSAGRASGSPGWCAGEACIHVEPPRRDPI